MLLDTDEARKGWKPYVDAVISFTLMRTNNIPEYYVMNTERAFKFTSYWRESFSSDGIGNADDLKEKMEWRLSTGSRQEFSQYSRELSMMSKSNQSQYIEAITDPSLKHRLEVVHKYLRRMPSGGIGAYEFSWMMIGCFAGKELSYLTKDEAWNYVAKIIPLIKQNYRSWYDYAMSYTVGYTYFKHRMSPEDELRHKEGLMKLLNYPNSPVLQVKI